jgi:hypothetical protein
MSKYCCPNCDAEIRIDNTIQNYAKKCEIVCLNCEKHSVLKIDETAYFWASLAGGIAWLIVFLAMSVLGFLYADFFALSFGLVTCCLVVYRKNFKLISVSRQ